MSLWRYLWPTYHTLEFQKIYIMCEMHARERVLKVWRWYLHLFRRYRKKTRGGLQSAEYFCRVLYLHMQAWGDWRTDTVSVIEVNGWLVGVGSRFHCWNQCDFFAKWWKETAAFNPRHDGGWMATRPDGGGKGPPWDLPNYWTDFQFSNAIR